MGKPVVLDVDGVLADFNSPFVAMLREVDPALVIDSDPRAQSTWDFQAPEDTVNEAWRRIDADPTWWQRVKPLPYHDYAAPLLSTWASNRDREIIVMTSRRGGAGLGHIVRRWLATHCMFYDLNVLLVTKATRKADVARALGADIVIDDAPHTLRAYVDKGIQHVYAPAYGYNQGIEGVTYVGDFADFVMEVGKI